jgi:coenzyme F420-reducing hydrogenase alpha subunit
LKNLLEKVKATRKSAERALKLVSKIKFPELKVDLEFLAQKDGRIVSSRGEESSVGNYKRVITEELRKYSTAKFGKYKGREIMVGALARVHFLAQTDPKFAKGLDFQNPFHNNWAQAIEILRYHRQAEYLLTQLTKSDVVGSSRRPWKPGAGDLKGIGAVEAPRGGLYHEFHFDKTGLIKYANIITPTVQNLTSIEKSANALLEQHSSRPKKEIQRLLEMLVRAYDPCITCSTH